MDQLRNALSGAGLEGDAAAAAKSRAPKGPDLYGTEWVRLLGRFTTVPKGKSQGNLENLLHKTVKELKARGQKRDSRELADLHSGWRKKVDKQAWASVKARFAELELSDKSYRATKQGFKDPAKLLAKLTTRKAEEFRGASTKRLLAWLR